MATSVRLISGIHLSLALPLFQYPTWTAQKCKQSQVLYCTNCNLQTVEFKPFYVFGIHVKRAVYLLCEDQNFESANNPLPHQKGWDLQKVPLGQKAVNFCCDDCLQKMHDYLQSSHFYFTVNKAVPCDLCLPKKSFIVFFPFLSDSQLFIKLLDMKFCTNNNLEVYNVYIKRNDALQMPSSQHTYL